MKEHIYSQRIYDIYLESNKVVFQNYNFFSCFPIPSQVLEKYRGSAAQEKCKFQVLGEKRSILIEEGIDEDNRAFKKVVFIAESGVKFDAFISKTANDCCTTETTTPRDTSKDNQKRLHPTKHIKYAISNTGRLAYGTVEDVREIYKLHAANSSASKKEKPTGPHNPAIVLSKNLSNLSVSTKNAKLPAQQVGVGGRAASNLSSATNGGKLPQQVGVGVNGRVAAMSRMAAFGEEWAEEEDLPMAGPTSHLLNGGGVTKAVTKDMQNSKQRQGQRNSAKSRY